MKKLIFIIGTTCPLAVALLLLTGSASQSQAYSSGPPTAVTGSPGDGNSCVQCHGGPASTLSNAIVSDIPSGGYVPGATYNFSATVSHASFNRFGFQISPQNVAGQLKGTLIASDVANTQLIGSGKWITHTTAGTAGTANARTWTFQWTAPAAGTGQVSFYGAFLKANNNNASSGDQVFQSVLAVQENMTTGLSELIAQASWKLYPMPCGSTLNVELSETVSPGATFSILSLDGKLLQQQAADGSGNLNFNTAELASGVYILQMQDGSNTVSKKFLKQ